MPRSAAADVGFALLIAVSGCGNATSPPSLPSDEAAVPFTGPTPSTFDEQVAAGRLLFAETCASCHGDAGEGKDDVPPVIGLQLGALPLEPPVDRKLRRYRFETVGDVAQFVIRTMPLYAPGRLGDEQYFSVVAFDLEANGIDLGDKKLDAELAASLKIPRK